MKSTTTAVGMTSGSLLVPDSSWAVVERAPTARDADHRSDHGISVSSTLGHRSHIMAAMSLMGGT